MPVTSLFQPLTDIYNTIDTTSITPEALTAEIKSLVGPGVELPDEDLEYAVGELYVFFLFSSLCHPVDMSTDVVPAAHAHRPPTSRTRRRSSAGWSRRRRSR